MANVISIHRITLNDPEADMIFTGQFDPDGSAIVRKATIEVLPEQRFELEDEAELKRLLDMGAVRYPTAGENALHEAGIDSETDDWRKSA